MPWAFLLACGFEGTESATPSSGGDGGPDTPSPQPCVPGIFNACELAAPTQSLSVTSAMSLDTDSDPRCVATAQASGPSVCLMYFQDVAISASGRLVVTGAAPLALVAKGSMTIAGLLDVSSRRDPSQRGAGSAPAGLCSFAGAPANQLTGAGGGAGGSFATKAGHGGRGSVLGMSSAAGGQAAEAVPWSVLRGGCDGQVGGEGDDAPGGAGGAGGGAVYLSAATLQLSGAVFAGGAAGSGGSFDDGGGGGGSGGAIVLESDQLTISGRVFATGGGGGGGGETFQTGGNGQDGSRSSAAAGGKGGDEGDGGAGATDAAGTSGADGTNHSGGGGGGGGAGFIVFIGASPVTQGASVMPPAAMRER